MFFDGTKECLNCKINNYPIQFVNYAKDKYMIIYNNLYIFFDLPNKFLFKNNSFILNNPTAQKLEKHFLLL